MSTNFKPGDLALYIGSADWDLSAGDCVELIEKIPKGEEFTVNRSQILMALFDLWHSYSPRHNKRYVIPAKHLVPINGSLNPEKQKQEEFS